RAGRALRRRPRRRLDVRGRDRCAAERAPRHRAADRPSVRRAHDCRNRAVHRGGAIGRGCHVTAAPSATEQSVPIRRLTVTARPTRQVWSIVEGLEGVEGGVLIEMYIGRYVLNPDGGKVWRLIDGRRSVAEIAAAISTTEGS